MATAEAPASEKKLIATTTSMSEDRIEAEKDAHGSAEELLSQDSHSDKKRDDGCKHCSCKKSRCLKLYCVCFAAGIFCSEPCACRLCFNKPIYGETVQSTRKEIWLRKQVALPLKVVCTPEAGQEVGQQEDVKKSPALVQHRRGCNCKKSSCLKKYCDCYQGGIGCSINCRCEDCKNVFGRKVEGGRNLTSNRWNSANLGHSEDEEHDAGAECSPHCRSPISRESSFQQETPDVIGAVMMDGQLHPQPVSQLQPWHCLKRQRDDRFVDGMEGYMEYKTQRDMQLPKREDKYTISRCIEVMNGMAELSSHEKSLAPDVFLELSNREIFLSLAADIRTMWLRRKIKHLM
ncbi:uncharacterized protein [Typha angustifolia]|uniref:uncharacterized protein isoform X1 n=1 Tax=Typha angustifolia TaxID=59011 RepID=UPI003C2E922B